MPLRKLVIEVFKKANFFSDSFSIFVRALITNDRVGRKRSGTFWEEGWGGGVGLRGKSQFDEF